MCCILGNIAINTAKDVNYCCIIHSNSKSEVINLLGIFKNAYLRNQY